MLTKLAHGIASFFAEKEIIEPRYIEVYQYGLEQIISTFYSLLTLLIIGLCCNAFLETILFSVFFIVLRHYAGGYHADTYLGCYLSLIGIFIAFLAVIKFVPQWIQFPLGIGFAVAGGIIVACLSPVEHKNRPLSDYEKVHFKKFAWIVLAVEILVSALLIPYFEGNLAFAGVTCIFLMAVLQLLALVKNRE